MPNYEQVIQTMYSGCRFRSRLEARWAVLLDRLGADWEYEPEGFVLSDGTYYLPDFVVHNVKLFPGDDVWIEVKGEMTQKDADKVNMFAFPDGMLTGLDMPERKIFVVGGIPHFNSFWDLFEKIEKISESDPFSMMYNLRTVEGNDQPGLLAITREDGGIWFHGSCSPEKISESLTADAYAAALQARFEHGETPRGIKNRTAW